MFPSFLVVWSILGAEALGARWPKFRPALRLWAGAAAVSCVTAGTQHVADVAAGVLVAVAIVRYEVCWRALLRGTEAIANSWREWRLGPVRVINHGLYAGAGTFVGLCLITAATGPALAGPVLATVVGGVVGAGLWAQFVEGSPRLLRPFGFYGGLLGVIATCAVFDEMWLLWAAHSLAGPWVQGFGRLRCLVQGCCHGARAPEGIGIVYRRKESRVTRIAHLDGVPVHATPLYSILWNVLTGLMLMRMWVCGAPLNLVCAVWLILNGIGRFAEERYRGEPQTAVIWGLRFYQWLAIASLLGGIGVSCARGIAGAPPLVWEQVNLPLAAAGFAMTSFALGVDFPSSQRRFARLT
jgi:prolipoprotein diacylglyceryltransferase